MLFQGRVDRAMSLQREQEQKRKSLSQNSSPREECLDTAALEREHFDPKAEQSARPLKDSMEKGDLGAMLIAGFAIFIPAAIVVLGVLALIGILLF